MTSNNSPDAQDAAVGLRLRRRREALSLSRDQLSQKIGVSISTIQKNEMGMNRIPAGRLRSYARVLRVQPMFFFADFNGPREPERLLAFARSAEGRELNQAFMQIADPGKRHLILEMLDLIGDIRPPMTRSLKRPSRQSLPE